MTANSPIAVYVTDNNTFVKMADNTVITVGEVRRTPSRVVAHAAMLLEEFEEYQDCKQRTILACKRKFHDIDGLIVEQSVDLASMIIPTL